MHKMRCFVLLIVVLLLLTVLSNGQAGRTYKSDEEVRVYADKVSPSANPYETYSYNTVPGCSLLPSDESLTLGELLAGDTGYVLQTDIRFNKNIVSSLLCKHKVSEAEVILLRDYIEKKYNYELFIDDMPVWAPIGYSNEDRSEHHIYLHRVFYIGVNNNQIVNVTIQAALPKKLAANIVYEHTYSVVFQPSSVNFQNRYSTLFESRYVSSRTRLISVINSVLVVFFLLCVIMLIVTRTLRSDYAALQQDTQLGFDGQYMIDESGWRCLYADVFRVPRYTGIFCGILGSGSQLLVLAALGIVLSMVSNYRISLNHNLVTYSVLGYVFTSAIAGYISGYQFMSCGLLSPPMASKWISAFHIVFLIVPLTYAAAFIPSTFVAVVYGTSQVPHLKGIIIVLFLWGLIAYPLCLAGVLCGRYVFRRTERRRNIPHVNQIPRLIPRPPHKLLAPRTLLFASGALPFMSIFVEFLFVSTSLWSYKIFHLYAFLAITTVLFLVVTACVSVVATFLLLTTENHHWKWMSIGFGASCSLYVLVYDVVFFFTKAQFSGFYILVVYFSYSLTFCLLLAIVGGTVGYFAASVFVRAIYAQTKRD